MQDGGPAFPCKDFVFVAKTAGGVDRFHKIDSTGLSLRDYFAAAALQAILPVADDAERRYGSNGAMAKAADYAQVAYALADAMLKAREEKK